MYQILRPCYTFYFQERDFEFAGEKDSYNDDEDFLADQEGSGDIDDGSGMEPSGNPSMYL